MKKFNKIVMIVLFLIFCVMAVLVHYGFTGSFDAAVYKFVIGFRSDSLTKVLLFITEFASVKGIVFLCAVSLIGLFWKYYKSLLVTFLLMIP